jgi:hypothetical protein
MRFVKYCEINGWQPCSTLCDDLGRMVRREDDLDVIGLPLQKRTDQLRIGINLEPHIALVDIYTVVSQADRLVGAHAQVAEA